MPTFYYVEYYAIQKRQRPALLQAFVLYGAGTRNRTRDLLITSNLLFALETEGYVLNFYALSLCFAALFALPELHFTQQSMQKLGALFGLPAALLSQLRNCG